MKYRFIKPDYYLVHGHITAKKLLTNMSKLVLKKKLIFLREYKG